MVFREGVSPALVARGRVADGLVQVTPVIKVKGELVSKRCAVQN